MIRLKRINKLDVAGLLFFLAGVIIFMGIITSEVYYPSGYSTRDNEISDLGATKPPNSIITQPSAIIFNTTMILTGGMLLFASWFIYMVYGKCIVTIPFGVLGFGLIGVGIFPGNITPWHPLFALITFVSGGIAAIVSLKIVRPPLGYVFMLLGCSSLLFLFLNQLFTPFLGIGGTERFVAYPIVFWTIGFGVYLLALNKSA